MSVRPAWKVQGHGGVTSWVHVRLAFSDGARVDAVAVVTGGEVSIEDVKAQPALSLADLTVLADWIEDPLLEACGVASEGASEGSHEVSGAGSGAGGRAQWDAGHAGGRRARPAWPRGIEGCRLAAREYRAAQEEGADPVLAVMCATGHSRRRSLWLIAQARDAGFLAPRHARR
ncbi:DUF6214 family protein [Streptomyces sp. NPDC020362]|uniref:DUF6214 family protein n=1 Tax=unclassified Streptomyces TaxID=2593676 RepID=UPI0033C5D83E